jgi:tripartite-type tricarboxylate transporter receptor subunit TctC
MTTMVRSNMMSPLTWLRSAVVFGLAVGTVGAATGQTYPTKPIKLISPNSAGSVPDALLRLVGTQLADHFGQIVTIENRPGGGTTIATKAGATADPDGYTLLQASSALLYTTVLYPNANYDPLTSFAPVATLASWSHLLVVPASIPANTVQEFVAYAKSKPGQLSIGFPLGAAPQVLAETFKNVTGAPLNSVPYRQVPQLTSDLLGDRVHAFFGAGTGLVSLVQQGKLKALAYTGVTRYAALPQVPTAIEAGIPQLALNPTDWTSVLAPAGTPAAVVTTLNQAINHVLKSPDIQAGIARQGGEARPTTPQEFAIFLAAEAKKWPPLVKAAKMQPE